MIQKVKTKALLWLLAPCGLLALCLSGSEDKKSGMQDQEFVVLAMSSLRFEIEAGGYAHAQGRDKGIIACGVQMASDYGAACTELAELAALKDLHVPDILQASEQLMLDGLIAPEGATFDQKFAERMVLWHRNAVSLFQQATGPSGVQDDELRQWAAQKLSMLRNDPIYQAFRGATTPPILEAEMVSVPDQASIEIAK